MIWAKNPQLEQLLHPGLWNSGKSWKLVVWFIPSFNIRVYFWSLETHTTDSGSHQYCVDVLEKLQKVDSQAAVRWGCEHFLWRKHQRIPCWSILGKKKPKKAGAELKQKKLLAAHLRLSLLCACAARPSQAVSQSVSHRWETISKQRHDGPPRHAWKETNLQRRRKRKQTDAIPPGRARQLHGEVSRVVVFYCGDDRLHELEENQKVPESWLKETRWRGRWHKAAHILLCQVTVFKVISLMQQQGPMFLLIIFYILPINALISVYNAKENLKVLFSGQYLDSSKYLIFNNYLVFNLNTNESLLLLQWFQEYKKHNQCLGQ